MGSIKGFMEINRELPSSRSVEERLKDWKEVYHEMSEEKYHQQGARSMDCGAVSYTHLTLPTNREV